MIAYGNTIPVVALVRSGVIKKAESIVVLMLVLSNSFELKSEENLIMQVTAKVDLGEDLGQNFGSIFCCVLTPYSPLCAIQKVHDPRPPRTGSEGK